MTKLEENAQKLIQHLEKAGYMAFFAGGYVRDKVMKRPVHDIDITTNAKPEKIKKVLEKNKIKYIEIGEAFGVIAAVIPKSKKFMRSRLFAKILASKTIVIPKK